MSLWSWLSASAVWSICSQRFYYNNKNAIMCHAAGSAQIIMHPWILSVRNLHFSVLLSAGSVLHESWVVQQVSWVSAHRSSSAFIFVAYLLLYLFYYVFGCFMTLLFLAHNWRTSFHTVDWISLLVSLLHQQTYLKVYFQMFKWCVSLKKKISLQLTCGQATDLFTLSLISQPPHGLPAAVSHAQTQKPTSGKKTSNLFFYSNTFILT